MSDMSGFLTGFSTSLNTYLQTDQKNTNEQKNELYKNQLATQSKIQEQAANQQAELAKTKGIAQNQMDLKGKVTPDMAGNLFGAISPEFGQAATKFAADFRAKNNRDLTTDEMKEGLTGILEKAGALNASKDKADEKSEQFYQKEWDKITKDANPNTARATTPLGAATTIVDKANTALSTLSKPTVTNQEAGNVMADVASIYQRGSPTQFGMQHQEYESLYGKIQGMVQQISGKPQDAMPDAIKQRLIQDVTELKSLNNKIAQRNLTFLEKAHPKVIGKFQDEWDGIKSTFDEKKSVSSPTTVNGWGIKKIN